MRRLKNIFDFKCFDLQLVYDIDKCAYDLRFKYPQHFTRLFKQKVGVTPNEYRNLN